MSKIKIKTVLKNKTENQNYTNEILGINKGNKIIYKDNNVSSTVTIQDNSLVIERKSEEYFIFLELSNKDTKGYYDIYNLGKINLDIQTSRLEIKDNEISADYKLIFDAQDKIEMEFYLKWEETV